MRPLVVVALSFAVVIGHAHDDTRPRDVSPLGRECAPAQCGRDPCPPDKPLWREVHGECCAIWASERACVECCAPYFPTSSPIPRPTSMPMSPVPTSLPTSTIAPTLMSPELHADLKTNSLIRVLFCLLAITLAVVLGQLFVITNLTASVRELRGMIRELRVPIRWMSRRRYDAGSSELSPLNQVVDVAPLVQEAVAVKTAFKEHAPQHSGVILGADDLDHVCGDSESSSDVVSDVDGDQDDAAKEMMVTL